MEHRLLDISYKWKEKEKYEMRQDCARLTLCNIIAKKTIISTSDFDVVAAAPNAMPSAVNRKKS